MIFRRRNNRRQQFLSTDLDEYYSQAYSKIASSGGFGFATKLQHKQIESVPRKWVNEQLVILEVGAGSGQHISFVERSTWTQYVQTDLRPPRDTNMGLGTWLTEPVDAASLPFPDNYFDRLIATCVLAHTDEPRDTLREWNRVVRPGGTITLYLPTEPSFALSLLRRLGPKQARKRSGFDPRIIHLDHRYNFQYLRTLVDLEFPQSRIKKKRFPLFLPWWLSVWEILHIKIAVESTPPN